METKWKTVINGTIYMEDQIIYIKLKNTQATLKIIKTYQLRNMYNTFKNFC